MAKKKKKKKKKSQKGGNFERDVCKALSLWWSEDERDDIFYRTSASGARATVRRQKGLKTADSAGDMMAHHESGKPFTKVCLLEFKRGYSDKHKIVKKDGKVGIRKVKHGLEVLTIIDKQLYNKDPILLQWWSKAEIERMAANRDFTIIIFQRDFKVPCVAISIETFKFLQQKNGAFDDRSIVVNFSRDDFLVSLVIITLTDFMLWCQPKCFLAVPRRIKRRNVENKKTRQIKRRNKI